MALSHSVLRLIHNLHSRSPSLDIAIALKFTFWDNAIKNRLWVNFCPWGKSETTRQRIPTALKLPTVVPSCTLTSAGVSSPTFPASPWTRWPGEPGLSLLFPCAFVWLSVKLACSPAWMAKISEGDQWTAHSPALGPRILEVRPKRDRGAKTLPPNKDERREGSFTWEPNGLWTDVRIQQYPFSASGAVQAGQINRWQGQTFPGVGTARWVSA